MCETSARVRQVICAVLRNVSLCLCVLMWPLDRICVTSCRHTHTHTHSACSHIYRHIEMDSVGFAYAPPHVIIGHFSPLLSPLFWWHFVVHTFPDCRCFLSIDKVFSRPIAICAHINSGCVDLDRQHGTARVSWPDSFSYFWAAAWKMPSATTSRRSCDMSAVGQTLILIAHCNFEFIVAARQS